MPVLSVLLVLLMGFLLEPSPFAATPASMLGVNYGRIGNNLPSLDTVPYLISTIGVGQVRLYDANPTTICTISNTSIELVVGLPDRYLPKIADDTTEALAWVRSNIRAYHLAAKITFVTIGNEVLTSNDTALPHFLLPAMESLHSTLVSLGLDCQITVSTAHSLTVLGDFYPPSTATFCHDLLPLVCPIIAFHAQPRPLWAGTTQALMGCAGLACGPCHAWPA